MKSNDLLYKSFAYLVIFTILFSAVYYYLRSYVNFVWLRSIPWLSMIAIFVFVIHDQKEEIKKGVFISDYIDKIFFSFVMFLFCVILVNFDYTNYIDSVSIIWRYILPVSLYFVFRFGLLDLNFFNAVVFLFSILLATITITESYLLNLHNIPLYGNFDHVSDMKTLFRIGDGMFRAQGSVRLAQLTGSLHAVLALFYLNTVLTKREVILKEIIPSISVNSEMVIKLLGLSLSLLGLYLTGSGTGLVILCIGVGVFIIDSRFNLPKHTLLFLIFSFVLITIWAVFDQGHLEGYYEHGVIPLMTSLTNYFLFIYHDFSIHALFGIRDQLLLNLFKSETAAFSQLVEIGIIPFVCLMMIMFYCVKILWFFYNHDTRLIYLPLMPIGLYAGTIHYETVFMYPNSLLFYAAIGMSVNMFHQVKNN